MCCCIMTLIPPQAAQLCLVCLSIAIFLLAAFVVVKANFSDFFMSYTFHQRS